ncbi:hypothetical protein C8034_v008713 [Colletotrichum sidae]|uniref:Uncharacterized protein n=2 Tax=Colletotrichum orbiculare species complex TaxID=2707354 RepID=A0A4R8QC48_9PEZI|nr:hypothetical protein C8035_v010572 [Colletotrichum spinosum]TEA10785.1 hypothetical protein C8034_v008713 [Colletotrichum sidae]
MAITQSPITPPIPAHPFAPQIQIIATPPRKPKPKYQHLTHKLDAFECGLITVKDTTNCQGPADLEEGPSGESLGTWFRRSRKKTIVLGAVILVLVLATITGVAAGVTSTQRASSDGNGGSGSKEEPSSLGCRLPGWTQCKTSDDCRGVSHSSQCEHVCDGFYYCN